MCLSLPDRYACNVWQLLGPSRLLVRATIVLDSCFPLIVFLFYATLMWWSFLSQTLSWFSFSYCLAGMFPLVVFPRHASWVHYIYTIDVRVSTACSNLKACNLVWVNWWLLNYCIWISKGSVEFNRVSLQFPDVTSTALFLSILLNLGYSWGSFHIIMELDQFFFEKLSTFKENGNM